MKYRDDKGYGQGFKMTPSVIIRTKRRCDYIMGRLEGVHDSRNVMIELGCGTGYLSYLMAERTGGKIFGTDVCKSFLEEATSNYKLPNLGFQYFDCLQKGTFESLSDGSPVYCFFGNGILHHFVETIDSTLRKLYISLSPGGRIVFLEPNVYNPYCYLIHTVPRLRKYKRLEPSEMAFSKGFIERKLLGAGFSDILVEYKDFLIPGVPEFLINSFIALGDVLERVPLVKMIAPSLFISAVKK